MRYGIFTHASLKKPIAGIGFIPIIGCVLRKEEERNEAGGRRYQPEAA
jgi:hypothetical protein